MEGMSLELVEAAADQLRTAAETGVPCDPVREVLGTSTDVDAAYAVQQHNVELDVAAGRRVSGHKIGLTAKVVQEQLGVDQPDYGVLFADMCLADGADIEAGRLLQPRVEAEVALVIDRDLDKDGHCVVDVIDATAYVLPALEIVDSRISGWDITIVDTVADNASCGLYVVGTRPVSLEAVDLRDIEMSMTINGELAATGTGAACLGNPLNAAVWLADVMCERGTPLRAGECLMTGSLGPMRPVGPGAEVSADLGPLGRVSTRLAR
ncbi:MAG: 2-keto-4-pentenoate hydratase [Acidimicrobiaceae bacterium]|nr:2-keto-4-pentenoate hydratase [Acidimicrobiaceae bacterium]MYE08499.1 2-keto-4-pentenoate hydratase [Acidimicrobiaceae bacterium]MYI36311.1 2-keto-4-pentenoate hydratase [Acidimicrobiaceae bacterium]